MKRIILTFLFSVAFIITSIHLYGQQMTVKCGQVSYVYNAVGVQDMIFETGNAVNILGKQYSTADIQEITFAQQPTVNIEAQVGIKYSDNGGAAVTVSGDVARYLTITVSGNDVHILADASLDKEITYTLGGKSDDGSFYMDGDYKSIVTLDGVELTKKAGAPITIDNGKQITLVLNDGTHNVLMDGNGTHSSCMFINGHVKFGGNGILDITGVTKHAFSSDEYLQFPADFTGTVNVKGATGDGLHIKQYLRMEGGTVNITNVQGDCVDVSSKNSAKTDNGMLYINGGKLYASTVGQAAKGLKADADIIINGGDIELFTAGDAYFDTTENDISSSSAVKPGAAFTMTGGKLITHSYGSGSKGINAKKNVTISGGELTIVTTGNIYTYGADDTKPHAIKSDEDIVISGGKILACASSFSGTAFKTDFNFNINGGMVMGIGGKQGKPTGGSQAYSAVTGQNVTGGMEYGYEGVSFFIPAEYSNINAKVIVSKP